jgi:hypothetical protein
MLATWGPATAAAFARYEGEPDPEILAAAQSRDAAIMADPVARVHHEIDFWVGRLEAELREAETIDDYCRADPLAEPLAAEQLNRFRKALHLVETGTLIPERYLGQRRADCLDMAGHAAAGLHRAAAALLMALGAARKPIVARPAATAALPADCEPSVAA